MDKLLLRDAERYTSAHRRKRRWYQVTTCLAAVVVFCTTYALILPAITLEKQCALPEHTHTEACYTSERGDLICTQSTEPQHTHTEECYQETRDLVCGMSESTGHTHGAECYDEEGNLICGQEESQGHVHGEDCYEASRQLICGQTEEPAHQHTEECYSWNQVLTCGMEEHTHSEACTATEPEEPEEPVFCGKEPHTHGEDCRDEQGELTCVLEEHTHSLACYADPTADVETAEIWERTFGDVTLTGDWRLDALAIAQSQLGYAESTKNYVVAEDGQTLMGYTRYGAWQGDPYGDWNAMFVAFCLHYGGAENIPMDKDCGSWAAALADAFLPAQSHEAAPGDLVFFDRDGDGTADRVAIVAEVTEGGFTAIEGNVDHAVQQCSYAVEDSTILGYGSLPQGPKEFTLTAQSESGITVTVTGDSASLPFPASEITLTAADVAEEQGKAIREQLPAEEGTEPEQRFLLDISLRHGEKEIEPVGPVTVTFSGLDTQGLYPKVYHIDTEAQEVTDMEAMKDEAGVITMSTEHFSLYALQFRAAADINGSQLGDIAKGGSFRLTSDADWNEPITITKDTVLDLNGCGVRYQGTGSFLVVQNGATLTIQDSSEVSPSESDGSGDLYGNAASLTFADNGSQPSMLTYYVTESSPSDTGTSETLKKYEVTPKGFIVGTATGTIVTVNSGGTFILDGGLLTRKSSGDGHIISNNGTLNLTGGYVAGGNSSGWGGGVYSNGTVSMTGGVIAANSGNSGGGMFVDGGSFTMDGGIISGNKTHGGTGVAGSTNFALGGGIFAKNATVTINGGYITNNRENGECDQDGFGCHGGGGIATIGGSLTMAGGYVTGNDSKEAGGGMYVGHANEAGTAFTMTGGTVASNCATGSEGGGIRVSGRTNGTIEASDSNKVYITNNRTDSDFDWGGGGIFVQKDGYLSVIDALITENTAGGFGGGVGACPTGETLIVNKDGAAIYGNSASGKNMSEGGNGKHYDSSVAEASQVFKDNGYKDYFCVRDRNGGSYISLVTGLMAGGGAANWKGSCDEKPVTIGRTGYAAAKFLFGLTANPDSEAISSAQAAAHVLISGNSAYTHGGGIMTNGGLILGDPGETKVVTSTPELDITGTKALVKDGEKQNEGLNFQFKLTDSEGNEVGKATANGTTGEFTIEDIKFQRPGTYNYTLSEVNDKRPGVTYDTTKHKIQVTIEEKTVTLLDVKFTSYYVSSVKLNNEESGGSSGSGSGTGPQTGPFRVRYQNTYNWNNVNVYVWDADGKKIVGDWPGQPMTKDTTDGTYYYDLDVTETGNYKFIFNDGTNQTSDKEFVHYAPGKEALFDADGNVLSNTANTTTGSTETGGVSRGANPDGSYTLEIPGIAFKNTMTTPLNLQITKTDSVDDTKRLKDATFTLTKVGTENPESPLTDTTGKDGIATFTGIQRGATYELRETKAPANYMVAGPWILEVGADGNATLYPATEKDGTLEKTSETDTGTALTVTDGTDSKVLELPIQDTPWGYKLPETGGAGTTSYTTGGLALIFGAATLLYIQCKRRKEDEVSS